MIEVEVEFFKPGGKWYSTEQYVIPSWFIEKINDEKTVYAFRQWLFSKIDDSKGGFVGVVHHQQSKVVESLMVYPMMVI